MGRNYGRRVSLRERARTGVFKTHTEYHRIFIVMESLRAKARKRVSLTGAERADDGKPQRK
jgi:hypothetical protein